MVQDVAILIMGHVSAGPVTITDGECKQDVPYYNPKSLIRQSTHQFVDNHARAYTTHLRKGSNT
jgi:hypothetical protein